MKRCKGRTCQAEGTEQEPSYRKELGLSKKQKEGHYGWIIVKAEKRVGKGGHETNFEIR